MRELPRSPEYTSPERYDIGLTDEVGNREFNPPSLRGVSRRDTLLHDGRAKSLEAVFQKERHPRGARPHGPGDRGARGVSQDAVTSTIGRTIRLK